MLEDILEELLEPVFDLLFDSIVKFFKFIKNRLLPAAFLIAKNAVHKKRLKRFNDELELKAEDVRTCEEYFEKKQ